MIAPLAGTWALQRPPSVPNFLSHPALSTVLEQLAQKANALACGTEIGRVAGARQKGERERERKRMCKRERERKWMSGVACQRQGAVIGPQLLPLANGHRLRLRLCC